MSELYELPCPSCNRVVQPAYEEATAYGRILYYKCKRDSCRCHFCATLRQGFTPQVTYRSKPETRTPTSIGVGQAGCPTCGMYGKIKWKQNLDDGAWRRHHCVLHGPYYSCEAVDGNVHVQQRMRSKNIREEF